MVPHVADMATALGRALLRSPAAAGGARRAVRSARSAMPKRAAAAMASQTLYDFEIEALGKGTREAPVSGGPLDLGAAKGKVTLIENVAGL